MPTAMAMLRLGARFICQTMPTTVALVAMFAPGLPTPTQHVGLAAAM